MEFQPLRLLDVPAVRPYFSGLASRTCDYTVGGLFMWRDFYRVEYALEGGVFYSRLRGGDGEVHYNLPLGADMAAALRSLADWEPRRPLRFCTVPETYLPLFQRFGRTLTVTEHPEFSDYLYRAEDLAQLPGRKYSGTRNLIRQFQRGAAAWSFRPLGEEEVPMARAFFEGTYLPAAPAEGYGAEENRKVLEVLENLSAYGMTGGLLLADGGIVGFTLNEIIGDTLYAHIEKADRRCKGAYQALMQQNAAYYAALGAQYINREEDMGDPGLRASKRSYHPHALLKKYTVALL